MGRLKLRGTGCSDGFRSSGAHFVIRWEHERPVQALPEPFAEYICSRRVPHCLRRWGGAEADRCNDTWASRKSSGRTICVVTRDGASCNLFDSAPAARLNCQPEAAVSRYQ
jgi:hypothetical protein